MCVMCVLALSSHSNHNNLSHQLKAALVCVSKKELVFCPNMWWVGEAQLVKLSNTAISMGKYVRSWLGLLHRVFVFASMRTCAFIGAWDKSLAKHVCVFLHVHFLSGSLGCTSMRSESHGFSRWSEELVKQPMRGWCHSSNRSCAICDLTLRCETAE